MQHLIVSIMRCQDRHDTPLPAHKTDFSAGLDLHAAIQQALSLEPFQRLLIPTGVAIALPQGYEGQIRPRSGLALDHGVTVLNAPGTIDADYRGEIKVLLINLSHDLFLIEPKMRIAQLVVAPYMRVEWSLVDHLDPSQRNALGFGSTGLF